jgi:two-component system cell cycle sensor histidine kinase/response regulator CckA
MIGPVNERARRILVVDDDRSVRTFAERVLVGGGYDVAVAADGPEALEMVERDGSFDLFVIDVTMPKMRGDELGRRLRQRDLESKILYFTGYSDRLFERRNVLWAHEAFLEKPVSPEGLLEAVSLLLSGKTQHDK